MGEGEAGEVASDRCRSVTGLDHHGLRVQTISKKLYSRPKGKNDGQIASFSHHTRGEYKNLPLPPPNSRKNQRLYRGAYFRKFSKFSGTKVQNVRTGVLNFLTSGKGVNTRTDNLRVHTAGSDTCTMSIGTTARSRWLEWRNQGVRRSWVPLVPPNQKLKIVLDYH